MEIGNHIGPRRDGPWKRELSNFVRGFSGAYLFGIPLLYTMEMWWLGIFIENWKLLALVGIALLANFGLAQFGGFKEERSLGKSIDQAIDAVAVGIVAAVAVLLVLNRLNPEESLDSILGKIIVQAVPLSIGASAASILFAGREGRQVAGDDENPSPLAATLSDLGATLAGGVFVAFSIAPTEEVPMLATEIDYQHEIALVVLSLVITYGLVFASGFDPQHRNKPSLGAFQHPITETAMAYFVALVVAFASLYLFGRIGDGDPLPYIVSQTLVLGLPAAVGGAAGRIAL